jgi:lipoprotein-anchoring transpeptidase ErfK/SrfK
MRQVKKTKRINKIFLAILPLLLAIAVGILELSLAGPAKKDGASGCGCDLREATGNFDPTGKTAFFLNQPLLPPLAALSPGKEAVVLGETASTEKWIEVDLSEQKLTAWEGGNKFLETLVSGGKWGRTPTGEFNIWGKFKYTKMSGGNKKNHTYYYLPNVPYTMYFYLGFGLHGTYWHNNFGQPMSHGCVNLPTLAAEKLFYWATPNLPSGQNSVMASKDNPGTKVVVHD